MLTPRRVFLVMGILGALFILHGCSSTPVSPIEPSQSQPDNSVDTPRECGNEYEGYHCESDPAHPKYDDGKIINQE